MALLTAFSLVIFAGHNSTGSIANFYIVHCKYGSLKNLEKRTFGLQNSQKINLHLADIFSYMLHVHKLAKINDLFGVW